MKYFPRVFFDAMVQRFPYFYMTLSFSYLGLMRAILDLTGEYLRGEHGVASRRDNHVKQAGWAEMQMIYDKAQSLMYRVLTEAAVDPSKAALRRAWSTMVAIMEGAPEMASLAIRGRRPINAPTEQTRTALPRMRAAERQCCPGVSKYASTASVDTTFIPTTNRPSL